MADSKPKGFVLTPSRFGSSPSSASSGGFGTGNGSTAPASSATSGQSKLIFGGLKQSKLGVLNPSSILTSGSGKSESDNSKQEPSKPSTFSFAPLSKDDAQLKPSTDSVSRTETESSSTDKPAPVFGQNLLGKAVLPSSTSVGGDDTCGPGGTSGGGRAVFGENLSEKAIAPTETGSTPSTAKSTDDSTEASSPSNNSAASSNGSAKKADSSASTQEKPVAGDMLFSSALPSNNAPVGSEEEKKKTLSESAAEYTETQQSNKRKYEEVTVVTGEEDESNVLQSNVKLYLFDREKRNWCERGRGSLRLNDTPNSCPGHLKSRLVMRTAGSLRVVLNTKLWAEMVCERVNEKNVRINAWDENVVKIFLISASPKETDKIFTALEHRINQLKHDKELGSPGEDDDENDNGDDSGAKTATAAADGTKETAAKADDGEPSSKKLHTE